MPRCSYPKCDRIVRNPNRFNLCHVHMDMADFYMWFSSQLQRTEQTAGKGTGVRASGLVLPPGS